MTFSVGVGAVVMNARQMLAGLPVRMAEGGPAEVWTPGDSVGRRRAIESGNEAGWLQAVAASADRWMANPGTAAEAYDAMVQSGIGIKDLLDAGVSQATIDQALSIPTPEAQKQVNRLTATSLTNTLAQNPTVAAELASRGAQDVYQQSRQFLENLQKDGLTDDERRYLQQVASQQGWGYSDIRAAGVDPSILFASPAAAAPVPAPVTPAPAGPAPVFPAPEPYTPITVYDPEKFAREKGADDLYAKGQPALDTAFRESPVRTVSPTTGQYVYTPAATLRPATGSGWSWAPPVVTSRPRQLLDVAPTASESQLYALSRQEQDRALRNAFASANIPASGQDAYYWQSRLRSGDYSGPSGAFDPAKFGQDFQSWAANRGSGTSGTSGTSSAVSGAISQNQQMYDEFGNPIQSGTDVMQPKMFLGFADGGDVRARELLDRLKKPEGTEERALGAEESSYAPAPGESVMGNLSKQVGRGARALRDIAVNLTPLSQMEKDATRISLEHFPDSRQYGGESDALRHMLFQAQAVQRFGQPAAKALSLINEYGLGVLEAQPREHIRMDLENDALGREIGLSDLSEEEKLQAILDLIRSGKAVVLNPQEQEFAEGGLVPAPSPRMARAAQLAAQRAEQRAEQPQTESRSMLERLQRFTSLDQPQDMSLGETATDIAAGFLPGVGTAQGFRDFERSRREGDMLGMVLGAASMIPIAGGAVRAARKAANVAEEIPGAARQMLDEVAPAVRQIDTPEFKNFFGESKVVNEVGRPLVVYHGTDADITEFKKGKRLKRFPKFNTPQKHLGHFFTDDSDYAERYAGRGFDKEDAVIMPVYLSLQNPKVEPLSLIDEIENEWTMGKAIAYRSRLEKEGYDGIIFEGTAKIGPIREIVAFRPEQIKSAIGNVGTFDPTNPVITKANGGEVSAPLTPEELLAQIDRSMASSPASAQGTASSAQPDTVQGDSRSMLRRISDTFGKNVTAPVVGSMLDMTAGVGDLAQMGIKAGAQKLGVETKPFTPVSSAIQESLGVAGYDPYSPAAIATAIGLPAAAALRAAGTAARGSRPLMSEAMPRTPSGRRPAPGSAEELFSRLAPIVDKEASIYASSELAAMGAREVAPDNMTAEIAAAVAGGGAYNTLDNILSSSSRSADMGPANTARSQMAQIYQHIPTPERPFVGRLDSFIANDLNVGRISRDELLARMRGKFRGPELLRVERAFEGVDPKAKLTPNEVLEKLQASYDPSDLELVTIRGDVPYKSMDNPWFGDEQSLGTQREQLTGVGEDMQGTIVLRRAGQPSQSTVDPEMVSAAENTYRELGAGPLTADDPFVRGLIYTRAYEDFAAPFKDIFLKRGWDYTKQFVLERLDNMESAVNYRSAQATELGVLNDKFETLGAVTADLFPQKRLELLEQGGVSREDLMGKAYAKAFEEAYSEAVTGTALNSPYSTDLILSFPKPENITDPQLANEFLKTRARPYLSEQLREISKDTALRLSGELRMLRDSDDVRDALKNMAAQRPEMVPGVNPDYRGQHTMVTENTPGVVSFSRSTDVRTEIPGMGQVKGIYLHELQSDLLDDLRKRQGGIPRGATQEELQRIISTTQDQVEPILNKIRELNEQLQDMPSYRPWAAASTPERVIRDTERMVLIDEIYSLQNKRDALLGNLAPVYDRLESLREGKRSRADLDEIFPGMTTDSKSVQTMMIKAAVASAAQRGLNFVALPSQLYSGQPQLYERLPQNARDVVKDLGEGFALQQINLRNRAGEFPVLAITWDQSTAEGREGLNRVLTRGVPFKHGGEVTTQPDDLKNLLSFLDKKPASKRK